MVGVFKHSTKAKEQRGKSFSREELSTDQKTFDTRSQRSVVGIVFSFSQDIFPCCFNNNVKIIVFFQDCVMQKKLLDMNAG